ncbi:MAG: phasin family protein [candidate division KSB1 bacterium]|nr:phasin family protein [candidate division KSB1 bacterium]
MEGLLYRTFLAGLGAIAMTREKVEALVDELVKKGEVAAPEKAKAVEELLRKAEEQEKAIMDRIGKAVTRALQEMDLPTKQDLEDIRKRLEEIEKKLKG